MINDTINESANLKDVVLSFLGLRQSASHSDNYSSGATSSEKGNHHARSDSESNRVLCLVLRFPIDSSR